MSRKEQPGSTAKMAYDKIKVGWQHKNCSEIPEFCQCSISHLPVEINWRQYNQNKMWES